MAIKISKSDLKYTYSWSAVSGDDPKVSGEPDSTLFSRNEGYEVLYLINKFSTICDFQREESCLKAERLIKEFLPSDIRSQENVKSWLLNNWANY
ncbi:MAG: hypothetical protein H6Q35_390 [Proteobacteria bacterium]|nr:hypothetical protein [Pseudomonadota bacterium]